LTPFTGFHLWLVANNKTTLEYCEKASPNTSYDFGIFFNFAQVFGYNPLFWLLPVQTAPANGLEFAKRRLVNDDSDDEAESKIRADMEAQLGLSTHATEQEGNCCFRRWDRPSDSPLVGSKDDSWWGGLLAKCFEINAFRDKCQTGFTNILSGRDSGRSTPRRASGPPTPAGEDSKPLPV
jgi:hypothetical protein